MSKVKTGTITLANRIARSKKAFDSLEQKLNLEKSGYDLRIADGGQRTIDIPSEFSVPAMMALQAILKQAMKLDAAELAEHVGLAPPKLEPEDQEVRIRMVQLALTEGEENEDA